MSFASLPRRDFVRGIVPGLLGVTVARGAASAGWSIGSGLDLTAPDGQVVRIAAIEPAHADRERFATALRDALGDPAAWRIGEPTTRDRRGRLRAQLRRDDGDWLQRRLVQAGDALVAPEPGHEPCLAEFAAAEIEARTAQRGAWASPSPPLADLASAGRAIGRYVIVEATVTSTLRRDSEIFLDTGPDWRRDFTVRIATFELPRWRKAKRDPMALRDRRIRVRGWLFRSAGPMIDVVMPEQIEIVA